MKTYNGIPLVAEIDEEMNNLFSKEPSDKSFTSTLKGIYEKLEKLTIEPGLSFTDTVSVLYKSNKDGTLAPPRTSNDIFKDREVVYELIKLVSTDDQSEIEKYNNLSDEEKKTFVKNLIIAFNTKCIILNTYNRFSFLNILLSLLPDKLYETFLSNNKFRITLITKGARVAVVEENGKKALFCLPYKDYVFPLKGDEKPEVDPGLGFNLGDAYDLSNYQVGEPVVEWPGDSLLIPENIETLVNPEISYPNILIKNEDGSQSVSLFETDYGTNVMQNHPEFIAKVKIQEENRSDINVNAVQKSYTNGLDEENLDFFSLSIFLKDNFYGKSTHDKIILEIPLITPRQDILMRVVDEKEELKPIFFSCCC